MEADFSLVKADRNLFAIYHTLYGGADIEMWFDWDRRLDDTKWSDNGYFLLSDGRKAGGVLIEDDCVRNAFLVPPFGDRTRFWRYVLSRAPRDKIVGALDADVRTLMTLGYKIDRIGQVMCRPTDVLPCALPDGFLCRPFTPDQDAGEVADVLVRGYAGGICEAINGVSTRESALADLRLVCGIYAHRNWSRVITNASSGKIAAVCLAGTGENYVHKYAEIADICVLPEYRKRGLAKYLIARVTTEARDDAPFVKLFVYVGNSAECLYREMGFVAGPQFTNMSGSTK